MSSLIKSSYEPENDILFVLVIKNFLQFPFVPAFIIQNLMLSRFIPVYLLFSFLFLCAGKAMGKGFLR